MEQSANRIDPSRNALFDTRLTPIARLSGATSLEDFVNMLKAGKPAHLHRAVAEAMTVNETSFFRDIGPFDMLPARMLLKYMVRDGEEWEVVPRIRSMCEFRYANLCAPMPQLPVFDLVMLRNVLLYFSQHDRRTLFGEIYRKITRGGYPVLGNAEQAEDSTILFEVEFAANCYFYRPVNEA